MQWAREQGATMVTSSRIAQQVDRDLQRLNGELDFLPDLAMDWDEETIENRIIWNAEWGQLMTFLMALHRAYQSGHMGEEQHARYVALAHRLREALPLLRRLELVERFPVPLDDVA